MDNASLLSACLALDESVTVEEKANCTAISVPLQRLHEILQKLRADFSLAFDTLLSHTAVHWNEAETFEVLYRLYSSKERHHLFVTARVPAADAIVPSASDIWKIAEWQEREVYDLFGIRYSDHPDLRRLLLEDDWNGYPLRKDYKDDFMLEGP